jgi:hypothetical protein
MRFHSFFPSEGSLFGISWLSELRITMNVFLLILDKFLFRI